MSDTTNITTAAPHVVIYTSPDGHCSQVFGPFPTEDHADCWVDYTQAWSQEHPKGGLNGTFHIQPLERPLSEADGYPAEASL